MKASPIITLVLLMSVAMVSSVDAAFHDNEDGTVSDDSTGLVWQKTDARAGSFDSSLQNCQNLSFGGHDDWRMPTVQEIVTLFQYPQGIPAVFDRTAVNQWTSNRKWDESYLANVYGRIMRSQTYEDYHSVRCVRGSYDILAGEYLTRLYEYVADTRNSLVWTPTDDGVAREFNSAKSYCENLVYGSRSDWRLPTANEIVAIADYNAYTGGGLMVNSAFTIPSGRGHYWFWTLSDSNQLGYPMALTLNYGLLVPQNPIQGCYALCVSALESAPPTVTISGTPASPTNATSLILTVGGSGVVTYRYKLDNSSYSSETPIETPISLIGLTGGSHTIAVIGTDLASEAAYTTASWTIDITAPTATISGTPLNPTNLRTALLTVGGTDVIYYKYKLDDGSYSSENDTGTPINLNGLSVGFHAVSIIGKDSAGNWQSEANATTVSWTIDTTPTATISGTPPNPTNSMLAFLTVGGADVVSYKYKIDGGSYSAEIAIGTPIDLSGLSEGVHQITVIAKNLDGYWQSELATTTATWRIDITAPTATVSNTPSNPTISRTALLTVGGTDVVSYKYKLDGGNYSSEASIDTRIRLSGLAEGPHTVSVIGKDSAGNWQTEPNATNVSWAVEPAVSIAAGLYHSVALKADGTVWTWGRNYYGELGDGSRLHWESNHQSTPTKVPGICDAIAVAAGWWSTYAIASDGSVWAWGRNNYYQLGNGTNTDTSTPVKVSGLSDVVAVAAGVKHAIALNVDGTVWAWGSNGSSQLGDGTGIDRATPVQVTGLTDITAVAAGEYHSLAMSSNGSVRTWGSTAYGQLGDGSLSDVIAIEAGGYHTIALRADSTVWTMGLTLQRYLV